MSFNKEKNALKPKTLLIIPARMASTRFPAKPLAKISGITMIERVWKIAQAVGFSSDIVIATDDLELKSKCEMFGAKVVLTSTDCKTGMDRAADVCNQSGYDHDIIVTLQGDAVLTPAWVVDAVVEAIYVDSTLQVTTPMVRLTGDSLKQFLDLKRDGSSTGTTVTFDKAGNALYFSKTIIPFTREPQARKELFRHIGLYVYRRQALLQLSALPQSHFEKIENLEQLRALENGVPIRVVEVDYRGRTHASVDNPEDIQIVETIIKNEGELV